MKARDKQAREKDPIRYYQAESKRIEQRKAQRKKELHDGKFSVSRKPPPGPQKHTG